MKNDKDEASRRVPTDISVIRLFRPFSFVNA